MMSKIASDAYSQGAYDALQGMDLPHHIKIAAADHLTKESSALKNLAARTKGVFTRGANRESEIARRAGLLEGGDVAAKKQLLQDSLTAGGLGTLGLGTLGAAAMSGGGAEDDFLTRAQQGDLTNEEIAMLAGGTAALGAGGAYAAGLI